MSEDGPGGADGGDDPPKLDGDRVDELLRALADRRRRFVLYGGRELDGDAFSVDELADYVAGNAPGADGREQLLLELHHAQLPALSDAGLVDYDPRSRTVRFRAVPRIDELLLPVGRVEAGAPVDPTR